MKNTLKNLSITGFVASTFFVAPAVSAADLFNLTISSYGSIADDANPFNAAARSVIDTAVGELETQINSNFPDIDLDPFTKSTAKAAGVSPSGVGIDYASDFGFGYIAANIAIASGATVGEIKDLATPPADLTKIGKVGLGGSIALTLGLSFKHLPKIPVFGDIFEPSRTRGYLSFYKGGKEFASEDATQPSFAITNSIFSAHGQYKLVEGMSVGLGTFKWGGVDVSGGLRYSKSAVSLSQPLSGLSSTALDLGGGLGNVTAEFTGDAVVSVNTSTFSIPLEVSTSTRLLHVLGLFLGTGLDLNFGSAKSGLSIASPVTFENNLISGVTAQADANLNATGKPTFTNLKYFAGVQFEILAIAISAQFTGSLLDSGKAINVGAKLFW